MADERELPGTLMTRFGVKNYKCLKDIDIPLTPIHVIIGQNDAGKTSLLEAMLAFFRSSQQNLLKAFSGKWKGKELVFEGAAMPLIEFNSGLRVINSDQKSPCEIDYGFQVDFSQDHPARDGEWIRDAQDADRRALRAGHPHATLVSELHTKWTEPERGRLSVVKNCLHPVHLYQFDPKMMATPATIDPTRKFRMDPDGFGLATLLDDILGFEAERFIELRKRFCEYFPQFRTVRIEAQEAALRQYNETGISSMGSGAGKGIFFETKNGRTIRAQQASDGAILFLGFLAITFLPEPPKLILIEEPEKGVYPKRLEEIVKLLRDVVSKASIASRPQIILSTHSPYLLSAFEPEEITLMSRDPGNGVVAHPFRNIPNLKERLADGFNINHPLQWGDLRLA